MKEIALIIFGWLLGLVSPIILEGFKDRRRLKSFSSSLKVELEDLQYRMAISSFYLVQKHGRLTSEIADWLKPILDRYSGDEKSDGIRAWVEKISALEDHELSEITKQARADENKGSVLVTFQASFLESHLAEISNLPISYQRKIHEFRNQLAILNQHVLRANKYFDMTFSSSLSEENEAIVRAELGKQYIVIQEREKYITEKIQSILAED